MENVPASIKYQVMGRLWKAFEMLLQNCQPVDFMMIDQKLTEDSRFEINKMQKEFEAYKEQLDEEHKTMKEKLQTTLQSYAELLDEKQVEVRRRQEIERKILSL